MQPEQVGSTLLPTAGLAEVASRAAEPGRRRQLCFAGAAPGSSVVHEPMRTRTRRRLAYGSRSLPSAAGWAAAFIGRRPGLELEMTMLTGFEKSDVYTPTYTKFLTACRGRDRVSF